jgi:hypothetical protein
MNRLVFAILLLLAVLLGLRIINSPGIWQFFTNRINGSPQTQTTGFNSSVPTNVSENTPIQSTNTPSGSSSTGSPSTGSGSSGGAGNSGTTGSGTDGAGSGNGSVNEASPPRSLPPIRGAW